MILITNIFLLTKNEIYSFLVNRARYMSKYHIKISVFCYGLKPLTCIVNNYV